MTSVPYWWELLYVDFLNCNWQQVLFEINHYHLLNLFSHTMHVFLWSDYIQNIDDFLVEKVFEFYFKFKKMAPQKTKFLDK